MCVSTTHERDSAVDVNYRNTILVEPKDSETIFLADPVTHKRLMTYHRNTVYLYKTDYEEPLGELWEGLHFYDPKEYENAYGVITRTYREVSRYTYVSVVKLFYQQYMGRNINMLNDITANHRIESLSAYLNANDRDNRLVSELLFEEYENLFERDRDYNALSYEVQYNGTSGNYPDELTVSYLVDGQRVTYLRVYVNSVYIFRSDVVELFERRTVLDGMTLPEHLRKFYALTDKATSIDLERYDFTDDQYVNVIGTIKDFFVNRAIATTLPRDTEPYTYYHESQVTYL